MTQNHRAVPLLLLSACGLAACAQNEPPPVIDYDPPVYQPARFEPETPLPVEIVTIPEPLPLPGQLQPLMVDDGKGGEIDPFIDLTPEEVVSRANELAAEDPEIERYINAIQVWPYAPGALYQVYTAPEQVTDIALQPGEQLVSVSAGDTVRWIIGDTESGADGDTRVHILVKPTIEEIGTNLVILTDRRAYHLELTSTAETYMASVSWNYPYDALLALEARNAMATGEAETVIDAGLRIEALQFRYEITGDDPPWRPLRAFDDMEKVYIEFPGRIDQGEAPPLFVIGPDGEGQLVNYRVRDRFYIVDRLFGAAELRLGEDPQQVVRISRTDGREFP